MKDIINTEIKNKASEKLDKVLEYLKQIDEIENKIRNLGIDFEIEIKKLDFKF